MYPTYMLKMAFIKNNDVIFISAYNKLYKGIIDIREYNTILYKHALFLYHTKK